jgi:hypothetical protein
MTDSSQHSHYPTIITSGTMAAEKSQNRWKSPPEQEPYPLLCAFFVSEPQSYMVKLLQMATGLDWLFEGLLLGVV